MQICVALGWSDFGPWLACDAKCGGGKRRRERVCLAKHRWQCGGLAEEDEDCNLEPCPGTNKVLTCFKKLRNDNDHKIIMHMP